MVDKSHILIVDDDTALLQALPHTLTLRISGVQVDTSASAQGALELIQKPLDRDDVVAAVQRALQTHQLRRQVKALLLSLELHALSL